MSAPAPRIRPPMKIEGVRSPRRRKTITAEHREGRAVVRLPAGLSRTEERQWVHEYVVMHELAHVEVPSPSRRFWRLVDRYPLAERARGFLIAKGLED